MSKFALDYTRKADYDDKVELEIRLQTRPTQTDYKKMLDAIETLAEIGRKYVKIPPAEKASKK